MTWKTALLVVIATTALASRALARTAATGTKGAGVVACVADARKALAWIDGVRGLAGRLGLPLNGLAWVASEAKEATGADLLDPAGWLLAGAEPGAPVCVHAFAAGPDDYVLAFTVDSERRLRDTLARAFTPDPDAARPKPAKAVPFKVGKASAWRFERGGQGKAARDGGPVLAITDSVAYLAADKASLAFLGGAEADRTADLAFPQGDAVVAAVADFEALGRAFADREVAAFGRAWLPRARAELVVSGSAVSFRAGGANGGMLALVGAGLANNAVPVATRVASLARVSAAASGFLQVAFPLAAVAEAMARRDGGASWLPASGAVRDLMSSLAGDVTLVAEGGLAGVALVASVRDPAACDRSLAGLAAAASSAVALSVDEVEVSGGPARLFRLGPPGAAFRVPVFAAVRDGFLFAALSRARLEDLLAPPGRPYLDAADAAAAREAVQGGAVVVSHGYGTDVLGSLPAWVAVARSGLSAEASRWLDLADLAALGLDLLKDGLVTATLDGTSVALAATARFLGGDPASADARERAYGMALRSRYAGRTSAYRSALLDMVRADPADALGRAARRALVDSEPVTDAVLAAAALAFLAAAGGGGEAEDAATDTPCRRYLMSACIGGDPDGPACLDARKRFEAGDEAGCERKLKSH